ncbi:expressed protein [Echinococcus multilocularis]|uniref:Expressed protein n=1 Tax=Echinococcus multilocularis TaxID=6211 RepID=A0A068Y2X0_ECHMU|nr:expressed protein [Echinococcus multilocularis]
MIPSFSPKWRICLSLLCYSTFSWRLLLYPSPLLCLESASLTPAPEYGANLDSISRRCLLVFPPVSPPIRPSIYLPEVSMQLATPSYSFYFVRGSNKGVTRDL